MEPLPALTRLTWHGAPRMRRLNVVIKWSSRTRSLTLFRRRHGMSRSDADVRLLVLASAIQDSTIVIGLRHHAVEGLGLQAIDMLL